MRIRVSTWNHVKEIRGSDGGGYNNVKEPLYEWMNEPMSSPPVSCFRLIHRFAQLSWRSVITLSAKFAVATRDCHNALTPFFTNFIISIEISVVPAKEEIRLTVIHWSSGSLTSCPSTCCYDDDGIKILCSVLSSLKKFNTLLMEFPRSRSFSSPSGNS